MAFSASTMQNGLNAIPYSFDNAQVAIKEIKETIKEATGDGRNKFTLAPAYAFVVKFIDPIAIGAIIVAGMVFGMAIS